MKKSTQKIFLSLLAVSEPDVLVLPVTENLKIGKYLIDLTNARETDIHTSPSKHNYAYFLPFLFPKLERSIREITFKYGLSNSGTTSFRVNLPVCLLGALV